MNASQIGPAMMGWSPGPQPVAPSLTSSAVAASTGPQAPAWSPDSSLFWLAASLAAAAALIVFAGRPKVGVSARVGDAHGEIED